MGELDLEAPFPRLRPLAEDLEDQSGAVDDLGLPGALEIALLDRRQRVVDDDEADALLADARRRSPRPCPCRTASPAGRSPSGTASRVDDVEVDRAGEADRLLDAGRRVAVALVLGRRGDRHKDKRTLTACAWRSLAVLEVVLFGGARSIGLLTGRVVLAGSKSCNGAPGMMVEIACL